VHGKSCRAPLFVGREAEEVAGAFNVFGTTCPFDHIKPARRHNIVANRVGHGRSPHTQLGSEATATYRVEDARDGHMGFGVLHAADHASFKMTTQVSFYLRFQF